MFPREVGDSQALRVLRCGNPYLSCVLKSDVRVCVKLTVSNPIPQNVIDGAWARS